MLEYLINLDKELLLFLNGIFSPFWDNFFWIYTSTNIWIPLYIIILCAIFYRQNLKGIWTVLAIVLVIVICDQIASSVFKDAFERLRPSREPELEGLVRLLNNKRGGMYGFISSHAANSFGLAMFTSLLFRKWHYSAFIFIWASLNSYSRMYMGLHYPGDILGGLILGILAGFLIYRLYKWFIYIDVKNVKACMEFKNEVYIPLAGGIFSICMIMLCSKIILGLMA